MRLPLAALAFLLAAGSAHADLPVSYDIDAKTFKKQVRAGEELHFDLYADFDCTAPYLSTTPLEVGGDLLRIEEVKPLALKGQKPKPKKLARLSARLANAPATHPLGLVVTRSGAPLAGCQVQAPAAGPPSPLWISAYEFGGTSSTTSWFHSSAGDVASTGGSRTCLHAPIRLPDGALLSHFDAYLRDDDLGEDVDVMLFANALQDAPRQMLATGSSVDQPGRQIVSGEVTLGPSVDNELYHYYVEFCFDGGGVVFGGHGVWAVAVHFD